MSTSMVIFCVRSEYTEFCPTGRLNVLAGQIQRLLAASHEVRPISETNRILIDASPLGGEKITGVGRYVYELIDRYPRFAPDLSFEVIVPPSRKRNWDIEHWDDKANLNLKAVDIPSAGPKRQIYYLLRRRNYRLFHSTTSYLPFGQSPPTIVTIHDLKYLMDSSYLRELSMLKRYYIYFFIHRSAKRADHVITVSENTAEDLSRKTGIPTSKISSIHLGPSEIGPCDTETPPVRGDYILTVGELRPHKNLQTLIAAFNKLCVDLDPPYPDLVIVGSDYGGMLEELRKSVEKQFESNVQFTGRVSDEMLACLYRDARVFAFPSKYEGFGLPVVEAMSYGIPIVASNTTAIPEVAGDAAIFFDPDDPDELKEILRRVLTDTGIWEHYSAKSVQRYKSFDWDDTARETISIYRELV